MGRRRVFHSPFNPLSLISIAMLAAIVLREALESEKMIISPTVPHIICAAGNCHHCDCDTTTAQRKITSQSTFVSMYGHCRHALVPRITRLLQLSLGETDVLVSAVENVAVLADERTVGYGASSLLRFNSVVPPRRTHYPWGWAPPNSYFPVKIRASLAFFGDKLLLPRR